MIKMNLMAVKKGSNQKGFTLVEMIFAISIITLISVTMLIGYRSGFTVNDLKRSAVRAALDLRRAQNAALNTTIFGAEPPFGYGVYFSINTPTEYTVFADLNDDRVYNGPGEIVEVVKLENGVSISDLSALPSLHIAFRAPEPKTFINNSNSGTATITFQLDNDPTQTRRIRINISGQIDIE